MGVFDFLRDKPAQPAALSPTPSSNVMDGLTPAAPQPAPAPAAQPEQPGLFHQLMNYVTSPEGRIGIGTALRSWGGDDGAFQDQARIQQQFAAQRKLQEQTEDRTRKNMAFKKAYQNGKFDPAVYVANLGASDVDPEDIAKTAKAFAPEGGVSGDFSYTKDPLSGAVTWGGERPMSYSDQHAVQALQETERHNKVNEGQGGARLGYEGQRVQIERQRERRAAANTGAGLPSLPPGFVVEK